MNDIPAAIWDLCAAHPIMALYVEDGTLEVVEADDKKLLKKESKTLTEEQKRAAFPSIDNVTQGSVFLDKHAEPVQPLAAYSEKNAIALVKETFDMHLLAEWQDTETRAKVRRAIEAKVQELKDLGKPKEE